MAVTMKRQAGWSLIFSLWAAALIILSDAAYNGYILKLHQYEWAASIYQLLFQMVGFSLSSMGLAALHFALPLALAAGLLGLLLVTRGTFLYKVVGLISLFLTAITVFYAAPTLLLTGIGLFFLIASPHTHTLWDRLIAVAVLLMPLSAFLLLRLALRIQPK